jgi:hypothetical protein
MHRQGGMPLSFFVESDSVMGAPAVVPVVSPGAVYQHGVGALGLADLCRICKQGSP